MIFSKSGIDRKEAKEQKEQDKEWAVKIKDRDGWECQICGSKYAPAAHHIVPRENKDYRYCLDNGMTLCTKHHKFSRIISAHNNPLAFFLWLQFFRPSLFSAAAGRTKQILEQDGIQVG